MLDYMPIAHWLIARWNDSDRPGCFGCLFWLMAISVYLVLLPIDLIIGVIRWRGADGQPKAQRDEGPEWEPKPDFYVHDEPKPTVAHEEFAYVDDDDLKTLSRELVDMVNGLIVEALQTVHVLDGEKIPAHRYRVPKLDDVFYQTLYEGDRVSGIRVDIDEEVEAEGGTVTDEYRLQAYYGVDSKLTRIHHEYEREIRSSEYDRYLKSVDKLEEEFYRTHGEDEEFMAPDEWTETTYVLEWTVAENDQATLVKTEATRL